jgi:hypothetical protein
MLGQLFGCGKLEPLKFTPMNLPPELASIQAPLLDTA